MTRVFVRHQSILFQIVSEDFVDRFMLDETVLQKSQPKNHLIFHSALFDLVSHIYDLCEYFYHLLLFYRGNVFLNLLTV